MTMFFCHYILPPLCKIYILCILLNWIACKIHLRANLEAPKGTKLDNIAPSLRGGVNCLAMPCGVKVKGCILCEGGGTNSGGIERSTAIENLQHLSSCTTATRWFSWRAE